jgi:3-hydroxyisobutyrate dehydrogenase-like beta-hydroxyacid dehydrogenase
MAKRVGFIGVGMMGNPMCGNLLQAGFKLTVWNETESKNVKTPGPGGAMGG